MPNGVPPSLLLLRYLDSPINSKHKKFVPFNIFYRSKLLIQVFPRSNLAKKDIFTSPPTTIQQWLQPEGESNLNFIITIVLVDRFLSCSGRGGVQLIRYHLMTAVGRLANPAQFQFEILILQFVVNLVDAERVKGKIHS